LHDVSLDTVATLTITRRRSVRNAIIRTANRFLSFAPRRTIREKAPMTLPEPDALTTVQARKRANKLPTDARCAAEGGGSSPSIQEPANPSRLRGRTIWFRT
jgi:hypothetical protein